MTKLVRIENADMSNYKVVVQVFDKGAAVDVTDPATGEVTKCFAPDTLVREVILGHPTAMTDSGVFLTSTRYLVVKEE